jgi:glycosidase
VKKLLALLVAAAALAPAAPASAKALDDEVFYHIFTRSMRDSNGDRQGDLKGIEQSLPYLQKLGVTSILLTPLYPSPFYHNYFADSFDGIDPEYGTMADYRRLVRAIHARGMKLYLDQEFQYVATDHPWFKSALGNPGSPYSDFFIWHGPNNSQPESAVFNITVAERFPGARTGLTTINLKSPKFQAWATDYLLSWVDPNKDGKFDDGVDGFRIDHMMDDLDNKHILTNLFDGLWQPLFAKLRAANPKLHIIAEQYDWGDGADFLRRGHVDAAFAFPLTAAIRSFDKARIVAAIGEVERAIPPGKHELTFVENHDMARIASDPGMTPEQLRTAATLMILLKGTPSIYYGQELGMRGRPWEEFKSDEKEIGMREAFRWSAKADAPGEATWYKGPKIYWTQRYARDGDGISVAEQERDPSSLLNHYRRLLKLRAEHPAFRTGSQRVLPGGNSILVVERGSGRDSILIVANLSDKAGEYLTTGRNLLSGKTVHGVQLEPFETGLIRPQTTHHVTPAKAGVPLR